MTGAKIEEPKSWICDRAVASIVGGSLMKVSYMQSLITGDVMAGYYDPERWRHGGLQDLRKGVEGGIFLSVEDWHEPVQINLGPNVGDITTGYKPARRGRVIPIMSYLYLKPMKTRSVALYEGPGPKGGLRPVDINRHWYIILWCKIARVEIGPDMFMSRP